MRSAKKTQSYASKVTRSEGKKTGAEKALPLEEVDGDSVEQLMQQQEGSEMESSITTVDEVVKSPVVPQPTGGTGCPPYRFQQPGEPPVLMYPGGQAGPGQFNHQQQSVSPV